MPASYPGFATSTRRPGGTDAEDGVLPSIAMLKKREILPPAVSSTRITPEEAMAAARAVYRNPATGKFVVGKRGESLAELRKRVRARNARVRSSASRQR